jgi:hypothetical protein
VSELVAPAPNYQNTCHPAGEGKLGVPRRLRIDERFAPLRGDLAFDKLVAGK